MTRRGRPRGADGSPPERPARRARPERPATRSERAPTERGSDGAGSNQVEGVHAVRELLRAGRRRVREVWLVEREHGAHEFEALATAAGARLRIVTPEQLAARARSEAPQGVLAYADPVPDAPVDAMLADPDAFVVALDGITDPGNLGAILRTADTAGVTGVVLTRHRSARLGPTAMKAAAGAVEYVPIAHVAGVPAFLEQARRAGLWTVGLDADGSTTVDGLEVATGPVVLVLGAEGRGLARLTRDRCDVVASIPMHGRLESLNVSAAAAVALHAVARRRAERGPGSDSGHR
ncbi:MAG: 23S rRNA (guanosine(2251)-2'-O)-methyltransferase RlmB [Acidimicrobiia bacterium]